jgi:tRNA uridine 5-carbamoylmethylation protein Kti12
MNHRDETTLYCNVCCCLVELLKNLLSGFNSLNEKLYHKLAKQNSENFKIELIVFTNFDQAKIRNKHRKRVVPDEVLDKMISSFEMPTDFEKANFVVNFK